MQSTDFLKKKVKTRVFNLRRHSTGEYKKVDLAAIKRHKGHKKYIKWRKKI